MGCNGCLGILGSALQPPLQTLLLLHSLHHKGHAEHSQGAHELGQGAVVESAACICQLECRLLITDTKVHCMESSLQYTRQSICSSGDREGRGDI